MHYYSLANHKRNQALTIVTITGWLHSAIANTLKKRYFKNNEDAVN